MIDNALLTNSTITLSDYLSLQQVTKNFYHGSIHGQRSTLLISSFCNGPNYIFVAAYSICIAGDNFSRAKGRRITASKIQTMFKMFHGLKKPKPITGCFFFTGDTHMPFALAKFLDYFKCNTDIDVLNEAFENALNISEDSYYRLIQGAKNAKFFD